MEPDRWTTPSFLPPEQRWANPRFPLIEASYRSRLDEYALSIARCLGYTATYNGPGDRAGFERVIAFLTDNFSEIARNLIFDTIVICSEHGPLSAADLARLEFGIMEIENGRPQA